MKEMNRRGFLARGAGVAASLGVMPMALNLSAMAKAAAQSATDYKALVCIFLSGGNDAYNTVLATDDESWKHYAAVRGQLPSPIVIDKAQTLALQPASPIASGRSLALHPQLTGLQNLFNNQRRLAIISNVGTLVEPLTKEDYSASLKKIPKKLFSHNDQQCSWQALAPEGASSGWGGRVAEAALSSSGDKNSLFTAISVAGNAVWMTGNSVRQFQLQPGALSRFGVQINELGAESLYGSEKVAASLKRISQMSGAHMFEKDVAAINTRSISAVDTLISAIPSADVGPFGGGGAMMYRKPDGSTAVNPLAQQLQMVARTMSARSSLGQRRQIFYVNLGGFDTHDSQMARHADLMARLNHAMMYFDNVVAALGLTDQVTTFTASDFGRSFTSNGDGTDHGWGAHHFVMGGAVAGGTVVGDLPVYAAKNYSNNNFDGSPDQISNGVLLPKVSVEQYGAALGRWFGAGSAIADIFPNVGRFNNLASFMRA